MHINDCIGQLQGPLERNQFIPPPRFADKTFTAFKIDDSIAGQREAVDQVITFATQGRRRWWQIQRRQERPGLYLDGDFGVGKTHLLSAAWHAALGTRSYLSFSEAISLTVLKGAESAVELLASDLVCIDEFELDDPSNTRLADLLIEGLVRRGSRIMVTSNTVPNELGQGRLFVDQFRRQLNRVAASFADVHVPGQDYRRRHAKKNSNEANNWVICGQLPPVEIDMWTVSQSDLDRTLQDIPIVNLRRLASLLPGVRIEGLAPFPDQLSALRFVHLIDRLYDWRVPLQVSAECEIDDLFLPSYRELGYAKKYRRCLSRLHELCSETHL